MDNYNDAYGLSRDDGAVSLLDSVEARSRFLTRTFLNLAGAVFAFAAIEAVLFLGFAKEIAVLTTGSPKLVGGALLALCILGPLGVNRILAASTTRVGQYVALGLYVVLYVLLFLPILTLALLFTDGGLALVGQAAGLSAAIFVALVAAVFATRKDFSFLRTGLIFVSIAAFVLIVASWAFGFYLGAVFSGAMIVLACGYILYDASNVMLRCGVDDDIVAAIEMFGSVMLLFMYVLRLLMQLRGND